MEEKKEKKINVLSMVSDVVFVLTLAALIYIPIRYDLRFIESGSMEPGIHVGAIVVIDPEAYENTAPEIGDIAMYQTSTREVVHRIVGSDTDGYIFKGDNNDSTDFSAVPVESIKGKLKLTINFVAPLIKAVKHLGL